MAMARRNLGEVMTDADLMDAIQALAEQEQNSEVNELLKMMSENRMISWEEAEQIIGGGTYNCPIKSSLPQQSRPTEPDNDTDVDLSIQLLQLDDPKLTQVNLNNMKRTPIPQVKRLLSAIRNNTHLEKIALANMGLYDNDCEPLFDVIENNTTLKSINLETNYLSGDFFARLFKAALMNQTLEEVKAVNQGVTFATTAEKEIIDAVFENRGLIKVSISLRLPEGRHKIENAMIRNQEIRRILRRQAAAAARAAEEAEKKTEKINESATIPQEMPSRKPQQPAKPTVNGNASQMPTTRNKPLDATGNAGKTTPGIINHSGKTPPTVVENAAKTPSNIIEGAGHDAFFARSRKTPIGKETNATTAINGTTTNKVPMKATPLAETSAPVELSETPKLKKTGIKKVSKKAKEENGTVEAAPIKPKLKKKVPKKFSLERASPEMELDTEELSKKNSVVAKSRPATREGAIVQATNRTTALESKQSTSPEQENNLNDKSVAEVPTIPENKNFNASSARKSLPSQPSGNKQPTNSIRHSSLVPAVFLAADQTNGPVKRNFTIPSKKDSSEREKTATKLGELKKASLTSNPLSEPMQVYRLKRDSISKPSKFN